MNDHMLSKLEIVRRAQNMSLPVNSKWTTWNVLLRDYGPYAVARRAEIGIDGVNGYFLISDFADLPRMEQ